MGEEVDIDNLQDESYDKVGEDVSVETRTQPKTRFVGYKTLGLATVIATLLGTIGGAAISKVTMPPSSDLAPLTSRLDSVVAENTSLKAQLSRMERDIKMAAEMIKDKSAQDELSALKSRLTSLETAEPQIIEASPAIDPEVMTRLEVLQKEGSEALDLSDILQRLDKLETLSSESSSEVDEKALLSQLKSDILTDETFLEKLRPIEMAENKQIVQTPIFKTNRLPFPKTTILKALDEIDPSESWLTRTLNKHITVQSEDNPRYLVELIELDLKAEDFSGALAKFDKLPEPAKTAGQKWRKAFEEQ